MAAKKLERSAAELFLEQTIRDGRATKQLLSIKAIKADAKYQSRVQADPEHARHLASLMDVGIELRPVVTFRDPKTDQLILADGFHRYAAHISRRMEAIWAYVIEGGEKDVILFSASANLENSKPTTKEDRKKAAKMLLDDSERWKWSDCEIGRRSGLSSSSISQLRRTMCNEGRRSLPEFVMNFKRGEHFRTTPYSDGKSLAERVAGSKSGRAGGSGGVAVASVAHAKAVDAQAAENRRLKIAGRISLSCNDSLRHHLSGCGISVRLLSHGESQIGAALTPHAIVISLDDMSYEQVLIAIAKLFLLSKKYPGLRLVAIRYPGGTKNRVGGIVGIAGEMPLPIEFMTPEEFVAEFAPKPDDANLSPLAGEMAAGMEAFIAGAVQRCERCGQPFGPDNDGPPCYSCACVEANS